MAELATLLLLITAVTAGVGSNALRRLLNRKNELKFQRLSVRDIGLSAEQQIRFCALARAKGISQKSLWKMAALELLEGKVK